MSIDQVTVKAEARFDGKYVLRTNNELPAAEVAVQKRLLLVKQFFRAAKSWCTHGPSSTSWMPPSKAMAFARLWLWSCWMSCSGGWLIGVRSGSGRISRYLLATPEVEVRDGNQWYLLRSIRKPKISFTWLNLLLCGSLHHDEAADPQEISLKFKFVPQPPITPATTATYPVTGWSQPGTPQYHTMSPPKVKTFHLSQPHTGSSFCARWVLIPRQ
jgi:hypothetical protein